jgi:hypothetical protein
MDELIMAVYRALGSGATVEQIHDACLEKKWSEEDIFLAIKAGENLYNATVKQIDELSKRPAPFGRTK